MLPLLLAFRNMSIFALVIIKAVMPNIYSYFGIIFKFYSNDHEPLHVHAIFGEYETIFDIVFSQGALLELKRRKKRGKDHLPPDKMKLAEKFVEEYALRISEKWYQFFVLKSDVTCEPINKKVK